MKREEAKSSNLEIAPWRINDVVNRHRDQCVGMTYEAKVKFWDRVAQREFGLQTWAEVTKPERRKC